MSNINKIDYKIEGNNEAYAFEFLTFSKNSTAGNISVSKDLKVNQIEIEKINL